MPIPVQEFCERLFRSLVNLRTLFELGADGLECVESRVYVVRVASERAETGQQDEQTQNT